MSNPERREMVDAQPSVNGPEDLHMTLYRAVKAYLFVLYALPENKRLHFEKQQEMMQAHDAIAAEISDREELIDG